jgi:hypothetical protein
MGRVQPEDSIRVWCMGHAPSSLCPKKTFEGRDPGSTPGTRMEEKFSSDLFGFKSEKLVQKSVVYAGCNLRTQLGCDVWDTLPPLCVQKNHLKGEIRVRLPVAELPMVFAFWRLVGYFGSTIAGREHPSFPLHT